MKSDEWFDEYEHQLDQLSEEKTLNNALGLEKMEEYRQALVEMLFEINEQPVFDLAKIDDLIVKPLNAAERFDFISKNSFHFMRYQQMKTMRPELKKLKAIYPIKKKQYMKKMNEDKIN